MAQKPEHFKPSVSAETQFARALRRVAKMSGHIVDAHVEGAVIHNEREMQRALEAYSKLIGPWAARQSAKMLAKVSKSNRTAYQRTANAKADKKNSVEIHRLLKSKVAASNTGEVAVALMNEQVALIKSLPIRAGLRAQELSTQAVYEGKRADEIAKELSRTTEVSESDALRIARTEVARSTASINQARAVAVGSRQYRWRNSGDEAVREAHKMYKGKRIEGMIFEWDNPPTLDDGTKGHPGTFPNCRCYAEAVFDENE